MRSPQQRQAQQQPQRQYQHSRLSSPDEPSEGGGGPYVVLQVPDAAVVCQGTPPVSPHAARRGPAYRPASHRRLWYRLVLPAVLLAAAELQPSVFGLGYLLLLLVGLARPRRLRGGVTVPPRPVLFVVVLIAVVGAVTTLAVHLAGADAESIGLRPLSTYAGGAQLAAHCIAFPAAALSLRLVATELRKDAAHPAPAGAPALRPKPGRLPPGRTALLLSALAPLLAPSLSVLGPFALGCAAAVWVAFDGISRLTPGAWRVLAFLCALSTLVRYALHVPGADSALSDRQHRLWRGPPQDSAEGLLQVCALCAACYFAEAEATFAALQQQQPDVSVMATPAQAPRRRSDVSMQTRRATVSTLAMNRGGSRRLKHTVSATTVMRGPPVDLRRSPAGRNLSSNTKQPSRCARCGERGRAALRRHARPLAACGVFGALLFACFYDVSLPGLSALPAAVAAAGFARRSSPPERCRRALLWWTAFSALALVAAYAVSVVARDGSAGLRAAGLVAETEVLALRLVALTAVSSLLALPPPSSKVRSSISTTAAAAAAAGALTTRSSLGLPDPVARGQTGEELLTPLLYVGQREGKFSIAGIESEHGAPGRWRIALAYAARLAAAVIVCVIGFARPTAARAGVSAVALALVVRPHRQKVLFTAAAVYSLFCGAGQYAAVLLWRMADGDGSPAARAAGFSAESDQQLRLLLVEWGIASAAAVGGRAACHWISARGADDWLASVATGRRKGFHFVAVCAAYTTCVCIAGLAPVSPAALGSLLLFMAGITLQVFAKRWRDYVKPFAIVMMFHSSAAYVLVYCRLFDSSSSTWVGSAVDAVVAKSGRGAGLALLPWYLGVFFASVLLVTHGVYMVERGDQTLRASGQKRHFLSKSVRALVAGNTPKVTVLFLILAAVAPAFSSRPGAAGGRRGSLLGTGYALFAVAWVLGFSWARTRDVKRRTTKVISLGSMLYSVLDMTLRYLWQFSAVRWTGEADAAYIGLRLLQGEPMLALIWSPLCVFLSSLVQRRSWLWEARADREEELGADRLGGGAAHVSAVADGIGDSPRTRDRLRAREQLTELARFVAQGGATTRFGSELVLFVLLVNAMVRVHSIWGLVSTVLLFVASGLTTGSGLSAARTRYVVGLTAIYCLAQCLFFLGYPPDRTEPWHSMAANKQIYWGFRPNVGDFVCSFVLLLLLALLADARREMERLCGDLSMPQTVRTSETIRSHKAVVRRVRQKRRTLEEDYTAFAAVFPITVNDYTRQPQSDWNWLQSHALYIFPYLVLVLIFINGSLTTRVVAGAGGSAAPVEADLDPDMPPVSALPPDAAADTGGTGQLADPPEVVNVITVISVSKLLVSLTYIHWGEDFFVWELHRAWPWLLGFYYSILLTATIFQLPELEDARQMAFFQACGVDLGDDGLQFAFHGSILALLFVQWRIADHPVFVPVLHRRAREGIVARKRAERIHAKSRADREEALRENEYHLQYVKEQLDWLRRHRVPGGPPVTARRMATASPSSSAAAELGEARGPSPRLRRTCTSATAPTRIGTDNFGVSFAGPTPNASFMPDSTSVQGVSFAPQALEQPDQGGESDETGDEAALDMSRLLAGTRDSAEKAIQKSIVIMNSLTMHLPDDLDDDVDEIAQATAYPAGEAGREGPLGLVRFTAAVWDVLSTFSDWVCAAAFIICFVADPSILTMVQPLSLPIYAALVHPRPPRLYWQLCLWYSEMVILLKCIAQIFVGLKSDVNSHFGQDMLSYVVDHPYIVGSVSEDFFVDIIGDLAVFLAVLAHRNILTMNGLWHYTDNNDTKRAGICQQLGDSIAWFWYNIFPEDRKPVEAPQEPHSLCSDDGDETDSEDAPLQESTDAGPEPKAGRDLYAVMFAFDFASFACGVFSYNHVLGTGDTASSVVAQLQQNMLSGELIALAFVLFLGLVVDRIIYLLRSVGAKFVMQVMLTPVYFAVFFYAYCDRVDRQRVYEDRYMHPTTELDGSGEGPEVVPIAPREGLWYLKTFFTLKMMWMLCSALQIKHGYPPRATFSVFSRSNSSPVYVMYLIYRAMPLLFEVRSFIDWTFSTTSLKLYYWMKLQDIEHELYTLKCDIKDTEVVNKPLGASYPKRIKFYQGCLTFSLLLLLLFFPLFYFSSFNPVLTTNMATSVDLSIRVSSPTCSPLFLDHRDVQAQHDAALARALDWTYVAFRRGAPLSSDAYSVQIIEFDTFSESFWDVSSPARDRLSEWLSLPGKEVRMSLQLGLTREAQPTRIFITDSYNVTSDSQVQLLLALNGTAAGVVEDFYTPFLRSTKDSFTGMTIPGPACRFTLRWPPRNDSNPNGYARPFWSVECRSLFAGGNRPAGWSGEAPPVGCECSAVLAAPRNPWPAACREYCCFVQPAFNPRICPAYSSRGGQLERGRAWVPLYFVLVSDKVPRADGIGALLEGFGIVAMYTGFVFVIGRLIRWAFVGLSGKIPVEDMHDPDRILDIVKAIHLARSIGDCELEEILYWEVITLYRSTESLIEWTGRHCDGTPPRQPAPRPAPAPRARGPSPRPVPRGHSAPCRSPPTPSPSAAAAAPPPPPDSGSSSTQGPRGENASDGEGPVLVAS